MWEIHVVLITVGWSILRGGPTLVWAKRNRGCTSVSVGKEQVTYNGWPASREEEKKRKKRKSLQFFFKPETEREVVSFKRARANSEGKEKNSVFT
jgi:hypothetical protein